MRVLPPHSQAFSQAIISLRLVAVHHVGGMQNAAVTAKRRKAARETHIQSIAKMVKQKKGPIIFRCEHHCKSWKAKAVAGATY